VRDRFTAVMRQAEWQTATINRIMAIARQAVVINRIVRQRRDLGRMIAGRQGMAPGVPLVRVSCQACGAKAGTVEWAGQRRGLISVTSGRRYLSATRHTCPRCGPLRLDYDDVRAKALQGAEEQRIVPLRAKPLAQRKL
jgi:hypothetical protein